MTQRPPKLGPTRVVAQLADASGRLWHDPDPARLRRHVAAVDRSLGRTSAAEVFRAPAPGHGYPCPPA